ncbi:hypothetical protein D9758_017383 [Tetrapyrgos nigripes]|uniref:Uncharacterized protein n=1 Tax=Tetrapyrgos nigripes TaxID=182062 RepID=A0A8H5C4U9_9AGAR|nr:hypothetical protein D9758_017383 [Tetrapyrgos nigripes]
MKSRNGRLLAYLHLNRSFRHSSFSLPFIFAFSDKIQTKTETGQGPCDDTMNLQALDWAVCAAVAQRGRGDGRVVNTMESWDWDWDVSLEDIEDSTSVAVVVFTSSLPLFLSFRPFVHPSSQLHLPTNAGTLLYHLPGALPSTLHPPPQRFPATTYGSPLLTPRSPLPIVPLRSYQTTYHLELYSLFFVSLTLH